VPFPSILAIDIAMNTHSRLYRSMDVLTQHTQNLVRALYEDMRDLWHRIGRPAVEICADDQPGRRLESWQMTRMCTFGQEVRLPPYVGLLSFFICPSTFPESTQNSSSNLSTYRL
jgi:hypothetical protein